MGGNFSNSLSVSISISLTEGLVEAYSISFSVSGAERNSTSISITVTVTILISKDVKITEPKVSVISISESISISETLSSSSRASISTGRQVNGLRSISVGLEISRPPYRLNDSLASFIVVSELNMSEMMIGFSPVTVRGGGVAVSNSMSVVGVSAVAMSMSVMRFSMSLNVLGLSLHVLELASVLDGSSGGDSVFISPPDSIVPVVVVPVETVVVSISVSGVAMVAVVSVPSPVVRSVEVVVVVSISPRVVVGVVQHWEIVSVSGLNLDWDLHNLIASLFSVVSPFPLAESPGVSRLRKLFLLLGLTSSFKLN